MTFDERRDARSAADVGLFGPDSVTWRIHSDPSSAIGGMRALLLQALNPLAMAAMDQHSSYRLDPWGRLARTSEYIAITTFGTTAEARRAGTRVRALHGRIRGFDPITRRSYRADDPELLLWVHATEVDSFLEAYRRFGGRLSDADADRYVAEMVRAAELIGLEPAAVPADAGALRAYLEAADDVVVTPAARESLALLLSPPMPLALKPLWLIPVTAAVSSLPAHIRKLYGLPWLAPLDLPVRVYVYGLCRALKLALPGSPHARKARARAQEAAA
jgi:uncharacterized protein (DUF2236 family)